MTTKEATSAIVEYEPIAAALATIEKYRGLVCDVTTPKGMAEAKAAHREVGALRIALEKTRKKVKEDVIARGKLIDGEANRIFALVAAIEDPIKAQIEAEERREEEKRQAAIRAEEARLATIERDRKAAEEKALADQRAEIARQAAALREQTDRAMREREEADRQARAKIEAEERAAKDRIAEAEAKSRKERQAEEDQLRAEREKIDAARREQEEKEVAARRAKEDAERKKREAKEAAEREAKRKAAELLDAQAMLDTFVTRFGHIKKYAKVVKAIEALKVPA